MKLEPEFYQNLFKALSAQQPPRRVYQNRGWGNCAQLTEQMKKLQEDANSRHVFVIERTGKQIASYGDLGHIDITDLTALVVGKVLAVDALAELVNGAPFLSASIEGRRWGAHFSPLGTQAILIVIFDQQTNTDLVGLRVRRLRAALLEALEIAVEETLAQRRSTS